MNRNLTNFLKETNSNNDFIGIQFNNGKPNIFFPIGYHLSKENPNDTEAFKDIITLIKILNDFKDRQEGLKENKLANEEAKDFPINAYIQVIEYYITNGYYKEREVEYKSDNRGKTNWKKTIQKKTPYLQDESPIYLNFIVRKNRTNENTVITEIHKYCVAVAFYRIGFLYGIDFNLQNYHNKMSKNKAFLKKAQTLISDRLNHTNNDKLKFLFSAMLKIISDKDYLDKPQNQSSFGTKSFNIIWEKVIDNIFGVPKSDKEFFYPKAIWTNTGEKSPMRPDTIMTDNDYLYILDAKYYQTNNIPGTADINKQVTYGDCVIHKLKNETHKFEQIIDKIDKNVIYNAFILPNNSQNKNALIWKFDTAKLEWKKQTQTQTHETIHGIYFDTKTLLHLVYATLSEKLSYKSKLINEIKGI